MARLQRQLLLYDSAVTSEPQLSGTVLRNADCGILRYRKRAARAGVVLTFSSPCPYCQELNTAIAARYVGPDVTVSCELAGDGCTWRAESSHAPGEDAAGSPHRDGPVIEPTAVPCGHAGDRLPSSVMPSCRPTATHRSSAAVRVRS